MRSSHSTGWIETQGAASPSQRPDWIPAGPSLDRDILWAIAKDNAGTILKQAADAPIFYGLRGDGTGYIMIPKMDVNVAFGGNSLDTMAAALPVFTKTTRDGATQTEPFTAILEPQGFRTDTRPVVLLTSKLTGSAAEILTLAMQELPNVTTLGEPTSGGLSDVLGIVLPNGWGLGLSHQTYLSLDKDLFEGIGIPPDIPVTFETPQYLAGRDPVLAAAFAKALELGG